jgi:ATP-dependent Lhr-like helicase
VPRRITPSSTLDAFHPAVAEWFRASFDGPTRAQSQAWQPLRDRKSTLLLAPTGSGKTLAAFLVAIERLLFGPPPESDAGRCRVVYISPLKALGVDVERNLRSPLVGIAHAARRRGDAFNEVSVGVRSGDTSAIERQRLAKTPPDILITTPESLYLMLTSRARESLRGVETVIVDEIHAMASSKRGSHLFLSLERLEALTGRPVQRVGLSATQKPLEEIGRLLAGGVYDDASQTWNARDVEIVDAGAKRAIDVTVEVPVEDMAKLGESTDVVIGDASRAPARRSIWPSITPRLVELIRGHGSTMVFVNSRRLAERLAGAINDDAGEELALAHHGALAREQRVVVEERLKSGSLKGIVATSSLELGLDLGAVDLVVQVEAPPSVASGLQRIGRANHRVGETPSGILMPKHRGDLLAAAAAAGRMRTGDVEETFYPRLPLDVLAQQLVAEIVMGETTVEKLHRLVRGAAPFAELSRPMLEGVLDMLSGKYPSDEFAGLRPRITWDRLSGALTAREGAATLAIFNAGTIPDRGLYGVYLSTDETRAPKRVGELDEEMVFETREGETFQLGASTWRVDRITHDKVYVTPAPGEPGKMPFWHGDRPGRPAAFGRAVGELARKIAGHGESDATAWLRENMGLDERAAKNLVAYVHDQRAATGEVPSDKTVVVERFVDELGDHRACVLTPFGERVHAPWAIAVKARLVAERGIEVDVVYSDDGIVFRLPEATKPPDAEDLLLDAEEVMDLVTRSLGGTSLFAARFRECAARALLLPRRRPGQRSPLWAQRKKSADLLAVAANHPTFPMLLEAHRELLRDVFDVPALKTLFDDIRTRRVRVHVVDTREASPFASSLMFSWVGNFLYDDDAPAAERKVRALRLDLAQLRELLGDAELRELFDADVISAVEDELQLRTKDRRFKSADGLHDLLLRLGDLSREGLCERATEPADVDALVQALISARRVLEVSLGGERRFIAAEDAARYRDGFGCVLARGLPAAFTEPVVDPVGDVLRRFARTHGPFTTRQLTDRFGTPEALLVPFASSLVGRGKWFEGEITPGVRGREFVDAEVLAAIKRRSLAKLRAEIEPVDGASYVRMLFDWHGLSRPLRGLDALLSVIEQLEGVSIAASTLETDVLPARIADYEPGMLDALFAAGEVVWAGHESLGPRDGRLGLYLADHVRTLVPSRSPLEGDLETRLRGVLTRRGALFFSDMHAEVGGWVPDVASALWNLVWNGEVTCDTLTPLRRWMTAGASAEKRRDAARSGRALAFRSRRETPAGTEGRWALVEAAARTPEERHRDAAELLLRRHGLVTKATLGFEPDGLSFSPLYQVLKQLEERGRARRGYFVEGLGGLQFTHPGADELLRRSREDSETGVARVLSAVDPAVPWGVSLKFPPPPSESRPSRVAGAHVVVHRGRLIAYVARGGESVTLFGEESVTPEDARIVARALAQNADSRGRRALYITTLDGGPAPEHPLAKSFVEEGFGTGHRGLQWRRGGDA